ncbi:hypothetical protein TeGR_g9544, partial [Tetraparma gracilis]
MVDDANDLVLVGDSKNLEIHAFDFEGNVVHSIDSPLVMAALAFRPGVFAPLSEVSLTSVSITTTSPITFTATGFKDRFGKPLATDVDFSNFAIKVTGDVSSSESNVVLTKTISGDEPQGEEGAVWFAVDVPNAGEWTFSLVDVFGSGYEEHIGGSPYTYFVSEGPTDTASCVLDFEQSIVAGEEFRVTIETYDFHANPTEHFDDVFLCTLDDGVDVEVNRTDDGTVVFSELVTAAGPNRLTIVHVPTNTEVASSPISFDVSPAAADAASSTHNLDDTKSIVSNLGATITVQVFPRDAEIGEKLKEMLNSRISSQNLFIAIELADSASDVVKGVEALIEGRPEKALEMVLWVLFMLLAAYSGPLGIYAMIERGKVKKGFQDMMSGTDAKIVVYARALDEATPSTGVYFSLMSFTFSTLMLGRKMGLPGQKKELKLKKRNLEAVMKEHDISLRSAGADAGGDAASIHGERGRVSLDMTLNSLRNIGDNAVP